MYTTTWVIWQFNPIFFDNRVIRKVTPNFGATLFLQFPLPDHMEWNRKVDCFFQSTHKLGTSHASTVIERRFHTASARDWWRDASARALGSGNSGFGLRPLEKTANPPRATLPASPPAVRMRFHNRLQTISDDSELRR